MAKDTHLQQVIREYLKESGRSARELSLAVGPNDSLVKSILSGKSENPRQDTVKKLAAEMGKTVGELSEPPAVDDALPEPNVRPAPDAPEITRGHYSLDVEVRGIAVGGSAGEFMFNGETVDRVRRPPGIANLVRVNAIYVAGSSMDPWRREGSLAYFTDLRPARPGDHVIIELHPTKKYENGAAYLKRLVSRSGSKIRLAQYNPADDNIIIDAAKIKHIYKVFEWEELLGI